MTLAENGLEYKADQTHAEILMRDVGTDESSKGVTTPGQIVCSERWRREGIIWATAGWTGSSKPEEQDCRSTTRLARYLKDSRREVIEHKLRKLPEKVVAWSNTDFAGRKHTRRSTSGGIVMLGDHCDERLEREQERLLERLKEEEIKVEKARSFGDSCRELQWPAGDRRPTGCPVR